MSDGATGADRGIFDAEWRFTKHIRKIGSRGSEADSRPQMRPAIATADRRALATLSASDLGGSCTRWNWSHGRQPNTLITAKQDEQVTDNVIAMYNAQAAELAERYNQRSLLASDQAVEDLLATRSKEALALDIGVGAGRDAQC